MRKIVFFIGIFILITAFALQFDISVNYKLNASFNPQPIYYPLNMKYLILKGYISLDKINLNQKTPVILKNTLVNLNKFCLTTKILTEKRFSLKKRFFQPHILVIETPNMRTLSLKPSKSLTKIIQIPLQKPYFTYKHFSVLKNQVVFPKLTNQLTYLRFTPKSTLDYGYKISVSKPVFKDYSFINESLPLKNFSPKSRKPLFLTKNSRLSFSDGLGYDFGLTISYPLSIDYNGKSFEITSEYGKLTLNATKIYYAYSLIYMLNDSWGITADIDTYENFYDALIDYRLDDFTFGLGLAYKNSNFLPKLLASYKYNALLSLQGTNVSFDLKNQYFDLNLTYDSTPSYYLNFSLNNWRFGVGYGNDLKFSISTGLTYYIPITLGIGYDKEFYVDFQSKYSDFDFGYTSLKNKIYLNINKNL